MGKVEITLNCGPLSKKQVDMLLELLILVAEPLLETRGFQGAAKVSADYHEVTPTAHHNRPNQNLLSHEILVDENGMIEVPLEVSNFFGLPSTARFKLQCNTVLFKDDFVFVDYQDARLFAKVCQRHFQTTRGKLPRRQCKVIALAVPLEEVEKKEKADTSRKLLSLSPDDAKLFGLSASQRFHIETNTTFFAGDFVMVALRFSGQELFAQVLPGGFRTKRGELSRRLCTVIGLAVLQETA